MNFFKKINCTLFIGMLIGQSAALTVEQAEKFAVTRNTANSRVITFEEPEYNRKFKPGFSITKEGINLTKSLKISKADDRKIGPIGLCTVKAPKAGMRYRLSAYMRAELPPGVKINDKEKIQILGVDHSYQGKWLGGSYNNVPFPDREWKKYDIIEFSPKSYPSNMLIIAYFYAKYPATIWIDDIRLEALEPDPEAVLLKPENMAFRNGEALNFEFSGNDSCPAGTQALISFAGMKKIASFGKDSKLRCSFAGSLPDGDYTVSITILDTVNKLKLKGQQYSVRVVNHSSKPANAAVFDQYGRLLVDGKPFMPVGFYGGTFNEALAEEFAANGVNTILFYGLIGSRHEQDDRRKAEIKRLLDLAQKHNIKLITSMIQQFAGFHALVDSFNGAKGIDETTRALVAHIKDHPALLAWYIADEPIINQLGRVQRIRKNINAVDIWHPTYAITCRPEDFPLFGSCADIIGVDPYPISGNAGGQPRDISRCAEWVIAAGKTGQLIWMNPQLTNLGNILFRNNPEEFRQKSRGPSADELIAMPLLGAIYGAKGFISYSYFDMERSEKLMPGYMKTHMPNYYASVRVLRKAEPYIMGINKSRPVQNLQSTNKNDIHAAILQADNGKKCVIICNSGIKDVKAVFSVGKTAGKFKSEFGRTREIAPGKFEFTAKGVQADILFPAE
ncbi:MAG: hypothetical protein J6S43_01890 [Lentisphaeria bacterium]|nr:hypothetical protein [Lentisphaeria bacterium]